MAASANAGFLPFMIFFFVLISTKSSSSFNSLNHLHFLVENPACQNFCQLKTLVVENVFVAHLSNSFRVACLVVEGEYLGFKSGINVCELNQSCIFGS